MRRSQIGAKCITALFCVIISITIAAGTTWSWYVSRDNKVNRLESDEIEFDVKTLDYFIPPQVFLPGDEATKIVGAQNERSIPAFVRLLVMPSVVSRDGQPLPARIGQEIELIGMTSDKWADGGDGYFYYLDILGVAGSGAETSEDLFTGVRLSDALGDEYIGAKMNIVVKTEAVETNQWSYRLSWWNTQEAPEGTPISEIDAVLSALSR